MGLDDKEILQEEPTPAEIAEACSEVLEPVACEEIAALEDTETAIGLAFTALIEAGENPEEFLRTKGILE